MHEREMLSLDLLRDGGELLFHLLTFQNRVLDFLKGFVLHEQLVLVARAFFQREIVEEGPPLGVSAQHLLHLAVVILRLFNCQMGNGPDHVAVALRSHYGHIKRINNLNPIYINIQ